MSLNTRSNIRFCFEGRRGRLQI